MEGEPEPKRVRKSRFGDAPGAAAPTSGSTAGVCVGWGGSTNAARGLQRRILYASHALPKLLLLRLRARAVRPSFSFSLEQIMAQAAAMARAQVAGVAAAPLGMGFPGGFFLLPPSSRLTCARWHGVDGL